MPQPLRIYIAGVVTLSAIALGVATLVFPADPRIGAGFELNGSSTLGVLLGVIFWTVLTLIASALPVTLPLGTQQAVAMAPFLAALTLGVPAVL